MTSQDRERLRQRSASAGKRPLRQTRSQPELNKEASPRRRRRRRNQNAKPKRYEVLLRYDYYDLLRDCATGINLIGWYQGESKTRRRSLGISNDVKAAQIVSRIDASGFRGDPVALLHQESDVADLLRDYQSANAAGASAELNRIAIDNFLLPSLGHIKSSAWQYSDYQQFKAEFLAKGYALGYLSRVIGVLRAAFNAAEKANKIVRAPDIPDPMSEDDRDEAPLKGRLGTPAEFAKLIDQVDEPHVLNFIIGELNTASRTITILEADTSGIDWIYKLFELNPRGRKQTKKYRPILRISSTWDPWLRAALPGRLITYRGKPVKSVKKGFNAARDAAGLLPDARGIRLTPYSIRHSLGRWLEEHGVPTIEREILFGHRKIRRKATTDRYSPTNPRGPLFLKNAMRAIESFVREINRHTRKWDLLVPHTLKPGYRSADRSPRKKAQPKKTCDER